MYVVHFTQASAVERAQALMSVNVTGREEKQAIADLIGNFRFTAGFGKTLSRLVRHGIGVHHAGMLPRYRRLVETLAQAGLLKVICGTDTLGVGINVPIRTVLFTALTKYDGVRTRGLKAREFHQIAGRAGRAGYDVVGTVVAQAPEHEVENARLLGPGGRRRQEAPPDRAQEGARGLRQLVGRDLRAPAERPARGADQPLRGHARDGAQRDLPAGRRVHRDAAPAGGQPRAAVAPARATSGERSSDLPRAARARGSSRSSPSSTRRAGGSASSATCSSTSHSTSRCPRSRWPPWSCSTANPRLPDGRALGRRGDSGRPAPVLYAQQSKAKGEAVAAMKADGIEYEQRMVLLDDVTWPKPLDELLTGALESYRRGHPWVADARLSPKSVVRDMSERAMTFVEYVGHYQLARSEGLVLRYLADTYRALRQTVPDEAKTEELTDVVEWLGELVRQVDSSLLDEWEKCSPPARTPSRTAAPPLDKGRGRHPQHPRLPRAGAQRAVPRVELAALRRWDLLGELDRQAGWDAERWREALEPYFAEHDDIGTGRRRPRAAVLLRRRGAAALARPPGPRRPRGRPRLGDQRGGRPRGVGRGGRRGGVG